MVHQQSYFFSCSFIHPSRGDVISWPQGYLQTKSYIYRNIYLLGLFIFPLFPLETATMFVTHKDPSQHGTIDHATEIHKGPMIPDSIVSLLTGSRLKGSWQLNAVATERRRVRSAFIFKFKKNKANQSSKYPSALKSLKGHLLLLLSCSL